MSTKSKKNLIRFDWALKRLLRNKANFGVLEGFLTVLLGGTVKISSIGESEGNKDNPDDKFNRVDIMAYNEKNEIIMIEVQIDYEVDFILRTIYGAARAITNHIAEPEDYKSVRKVYHISIVYFNLGKGKDYVYRGRTEFKGLHNDERLLLTPKQRKIFKKEQAGDLFPEFYILRVNGFNDVAADSLDEWIYYLKNDEVLPHFTAPGLDEVRRKLLVERLSKDERDAYLAHLRGRSHEQKVLQDHYDLGHFEGEAKGLAKGLAEGEAKGRAEGEAKGRAEGEAKGRAETEQSFIIKMLRNGKSPEEIAEMLDIPVEDILRYR